MNDQLISRSLASCILSIFAEMDRDNPLESFMLFSRVWVDQRFMYTTLIGNHCGMFGDQPVQVVTLRI